MRRMISSSVLLASTRSCSWPRQAGETGFQLVELLETVGVHVSELLDLAPQFIDLLFDLGTGLFFRSSTAARVHARFASSRPRRRLRFRVLLRRLLPRSPTNTCRAEAPAATSFRQLDLKFVAEPFFEGGDLMAAFQWSAFPKRAAGL